LEEIVKKLFTALYLTISVCLLNAQNITFSGILDSSFSFTAAKEEVFLGFEEYANLRMQAKLRDRAAIFGAVNLIAAAGGYAARMAEAAETNLSAFIGGENYFAAIELERLYFRLNFEAADFDGGLMRLPFGFGQVWGSSDFLNPKNPLIPDARPRAVLGAGLSWYPADELKVLGFGAAPRDPFSQGAKGWLAGISFDRHYDIASIQTLYSFETPKDGSNKGVHRAGFSIKADIKAGFVIDTLYTYNHEAGTGIDGLSFSAGADYSYFDGNLIVLAEYLYNGEASSTSYKNGGYFFNRHYLYTSGTWRFADYTNMTAAFIFSFDEFSFTPLVTLNHDLFQGAVLTITAQLPMDNNTFSSDGSLSFNCNARLRFRF
jgi:hypothetical protein